MDALWDFSFSKFFTPKVVGVLYGLGLFFASLLCLGFIGLGFRGSFLSGVGALIISPIFFLLYVIGIRVGLEGLIAVIRVAEESLKISNNTKVTADNTNRIP